eukprot:scaffold2555_cov148-Skeletonema_dohrnii-CCMP3373.AAC.2
MLLLHQDEAAETVNQITRSLRELPPRGSWHAKIWIGRGMYRGNYLYRRHKTCEPLWIRSHGSILPPRTSPGRCFRR